MDTIVMRRRKLLALSGTAAAAGLAGCSDIDEIAEELADDGESSNGGRRDEDDDDSADDSADDDRRQTGDTEGLGVAGVLERLHAPGTFGSQEGYGFNVSAPASIDEANDQLDDRRFQALLTRSGSNQFDGLVDFWDIETHVATDGMSFLVGTFDRGDVWRRARYGNVEYQYDHQGFAILSDGDVALGIEGEGDIDAEDAPPVVEELVLTDRGSDPISRLETALDVRAGAAERYADVRPEVRELLSGTGVETLSHAETYEPLGGDERPGNPTEYTTAPIGSGATVGELSDDEPVEFAGQQYFFMDRYGFGANAGDVVSIEIRTDEDAQIGILLSAGDGSDTTIEQNVDSPQVSIRAELPEDGGYNFIVYDLERLDVDDGPSILYEMEVEIEGADVGGPEAGVFEGEIGRGTSLSLDDETATKRWVRVFENGSDVVEDDIQTWIDANDGPNGQFGSVESVDVSVQGEQVVVEGTVPVGEIEPDSI